MLDVKGSCYIGLHCSCDAVEEARRETDSECHAVIRGQSKRQVANHSRQLGDLDKRLCAPPVRKVNPKQSGENLHAMPRLLSPAVVQHQSMKFMHVSPIKQTM